MAYALRHRSPVDDDVRRIMSTQLRSALDALDTVDDDPAGAIHECRKCCKKIRGAVRLVRPAIVGDGYSVVNGLARDAGRELAPFRDATVMASTLELLAAGWGDDADRDSVQRTAAVLEGRRSAGEEAAASGHPGVSRAHDLLAELGDVIEDLELDDDGFDAIGPGVATTYGRGRDAWSVAIDAPTGANFHEWRKRAKYSRYHVRLLSPAAPTLLSPLQEAFHDLTDALGDAHDLVVLTEWLRGADDDVRELGDTTEVRVLVDGARAELERRAVALGRRLYAESPKRFAQRLGAYWEAWTEEAVRSPAGDLSTVLA